MVGDTPVLDMSYVAGMDLSSYQFRAVAMGNDGNVYLASTSPQSLTTSTVPPALDSVTVPGNQAWGILQNDPPIGDIAVVRELGHSKVVMGTTASPGNGLKLYDTAGRLGPGTLGSDVIVGFLSQDACSGAGEIHDVKYTGGVGAQGVTYRAGQLEYAIKLTNLAGTNNVYAALPLGITGTIVGWYGLFTTTSSGSSGQGSLDLILTTGATPRSLYSVGTTKSTLTITEGSTVGTVVAPNANPTINNTFASTDTLTIHYTQVASDVFTSDLGVLEVHIITN
jgi:hypothetical protein